MSELMHYGTPHQGGTPHSGRYPYGSGENGYQRYGDFYSRYNHLKKQGFTQKEIAEKLGCVNRWGEPSTTILRARYSNAKAEKRAVYRNTDFYDEIFPRADRRPDNFKSSGRIFAADNFPGVSVRNLAHERYTARFPVSRSRA